MKKNNKTKRPFAFASAVLLALICAVPSGAGAESGKMLIPGGMAFGVKFFTDGAIVLGTTGVETAAGIVSPAKDAGIVAGDVIIRAGGSGFATAEELSQIIAGSGGKPITLAYMRGEDEKTCEVTPVREIESGRYLIGVFVRDSAAGIGTVTYIDPDDLTFGGLGHGIYDTDTSLLLPLGSGAVVEVDIDQVVRSRRNSPGELRGTFGTAAKGELTSNTEQGVFGKLYKLPANAGKAIPVGNKKDLHDGKAYVITTLDGTKSEAYGIEIEEVYPDSGKTKNFLIKVTDERLIEKAGGIVQGMSGSPIVMDGRLVGAVTHVLINDPLHGYGISIENMLGTESSAPELYGVPKAA